MSSGWAWKPKDGSPPGLRYEPGNWGDILKSVWLTKIINWLLQNSTQTQLDYCDPFAGAPAYPLPPKSRHRLEMSGEFIPQNIFSEFAARDEWPSAALLAYQLLTAAGRCGTITVNDCNSERSELWREAENISALNLPDSYDMPTEFIPDTDGLLLIDPYDIIADQQRALPLVEKALGRTNILIYIYNRAARNREELRKYRKFRNTLDDILKGQSRLLGRLPADAFLPSAHHEVLFLPTGKVATQGVPDQLKQDITEATCLLNDMLNRNACIEE